MGGICVAQPSLSPVPKPTPLRLAHRLPGGLWFKFHHPLELYVALFDRYPVGAYNLETLKEDAKRHGIYALKPKFNESGATSTIRDGESFRIGLRQVQGFEGSRAATR